MLWVFSNAQKVICSMNLKISFKRKHKHQFHAYRGLFHEECTGQRRFSATFNFSQQSIGLDIMKVAHVLWDRPAGYFHVCLFISIIWGLLVTWITFCKVLIYFFCVHLYFHKYSVSLIKGYSSSPDLLTHLGWAQSMPVLNLSLRDSANLVAFFLKNISATAKTAALLVW